MGTDKRARQKANRQKKLEELERAEKRSRVQQYGIMAAVIAVAIIGGLFLISQATGDDEEEVAAEEEVPETEVTVADEPVDPVVTAPPVEPVCPEEDGSSPRTVNFTGPPPECIDPTASYTAVFDTNMGEIVAELDAEAAPLTVNNFVFLARHHYYDGVSFHRVISDFMIQGGDANGNPPGTGGPGYTIDEEVPEAGEYQVGSLAMAKREPASTTGAQFFIVTGEAGEALPPLYSLFGQVTEGLEVVMDIEQTETGAGNAPTEDVIINSITITEA